MSKIVYIHGANSTSISFSYIKEKLGNHDYLDLSYSSNYSFKSNLTELAEQVKSIGECYLIGHSLGGLYAIHLSQVAKIKKGITIATPFAGSATADWARFLLPQFQLFRDVGKRSEPVVESLNIKLNVPWTQIVTTTGSVPWHGTKNDGVVTLASMTARSDVDYKYVEHNHYEVMCSDTTVEIIKDCLKYT